MKRTAPAALLSSALIAVLLTAQPACATVALPPQPQAQASAPLRVIAGHPVVLGLARQLVKDTPIEITPAAPARLPASRQPAYLAGGKGLDELLAAASQSQAVLTLRSVWPDDQLYPLARRANIHIVEIDLATPIEGELPGIALSVPTAGGDARPSVLIAQPWQDSANLARMAMTLADSLARLAPDHGPRLQANLIAINQRLQQAQFEASRQLAQADALPALLLTPRVQTLAAALQLEAATWQAPQDDAQAPAALKAAIARHQPRVLLTHTPPDEALSAAIAQSGALPVVVLRENAPDPVQALADAMLATAQALAPKN
ncbi:MAG: metal ABC transporter solute-binding protein, Zn/Mn family [Ottowia sp.]